MKGISEISSSTLIFLTASGVTTGSFGIFYFKALQMGKVSRLAGIDKLSLALTVLVAVIFIGETFSWKTALGAALIIVGTLFLIRK